MPLIHFLFITCASQRAHTPLTYTLGPTLLYVAKLDEQHFSCILPAGYRSKSVHLNLRDIIFFLYTSLPLLPWKRILHCHAAPVWQYETGERQSSKLLLDCEDKQEKIKII